MRKRKKERKPKKNERKERIKEKSELKSQNKVLEKVGEKRIIITTEDKANVKGKKRLNESRVKMNHDSFSSHKT